jgi:transposase
VRLTKGGLLRIDAAKRRAEAQLDGKFVVHSNDDSLTPADLALGYKQLQRVEEAWRTLKSGLRLRPVYHWAVHRIHAHVALSVLALLLERVIEQACGDTWRNIHADLNQIKLAQLLSPHGEVWQVTEPSLDAAKHLKRLELKNPPAVLHLT